MEAMEDNHELDVVVEERAGVEVMAYLATRQTLKPISFVQAGVCWHLFPTDS